MKLGTNVTEFLINEQRRYEGATGELTSLLNSLLLACKTIANTVNHGQLYGVLGTRNTMNLHGDVQKKLDVLSSDLFVALMEKCGHLAGLVSEEIDGVHHIPEDQPRGKYLLSVDPLDGSSNIDINVTVGTIFSVLHNPRGFEPPTEEDFLQKGVNQVAAGFVLYGPSTILILTTGNGVNGFTLDRDVGEFFLTHPNMRIPEETGEFAINMSNQRFWDPEVQRYVQDLLAGEEGPRGKNYNMRWIASMVAEVYRVLTRGGIFMYPGDNRPGIARGKLRIMYEANPMAMIVEQAGGICTDGEQRMLEVQPEALHQKLPVVLGSKKEVEAMHAYCRKPEAVA